MTLSGEFDAPQLNGLAADADAGFLSRASAEPAELDVAVASEPTDEVGGDFSDVIATAHGWLVAIGDVCGKGVEAAGLAAIARHTVHAAGLRDPDPGQVLGVLHDALIDHDPTKGFCTAVCAHLRTDTDPVQLEIASGGHPPALIRRAGGDLEPLEGGGMLLGLFDDAQITESAVALAGDDIVLLYTDGLTEARRGGDLFGTDGIAAAVRTAPTATADALVAHLHDVVDVWQDTQRDDMTILAVKVSP